MADSDRILERERRQMDQILELDMEELQVEEVDDESDDDEDVADLIRSRGDGGAGPSRGFTFDRSLASLHTYLGEVDDTHGRIAFLDDGAVFNLPMLYLEGVVLFPGATLPLRVIQPNFIAAVDKALNQAEAPCTLGVVRVYRRRDDGHFAIASIGTTAEMRQYRKLDDGSLNVVSRGQQRFRLRRRWIDVDGAPWGEVQIIEEDTPIRTPRDAFGQLAAISNPRKWGPSLVSTSSVSPVVYKRHGHIDSEQEWESQSSSSIESDRSATDVRMYLSGSPSSCSPNKCEIADESSSGDEELIHEKFRGYKKYSEKRFGGSRLSDKHESTGFGLGSPGTPSGKKKNAWTVSKSRQSFQAPMSFWPKWAYEMYDSYSLSQKAADLWREIIVAPSMDDYIRKPDLLSFYIASKIPVSESTRQELLEIDGISYRLRREIELLKAFNLIRCRGCQTVIAKRSDMVVMSSDGPLNAFVNPHGYVHETLTVYNATGLALHGRPSKEHSWFPGYAWTCATCAVCDTNIGWQFTSTNKNLLPRYFWGIRSSQIADYSQTEQNRD